MCGGVPRCKQLLLPLAFASNSHGMPSGVELAYSYLWKAGIHNIQRFKCLRGPDRPTAVDQRCKRLAEANMCDRPTTMNHRYWDNCMKGGTACCKSCAGGTAGD